MKDAVFVAHAVPAVTFLIEKVLLLAYMLVIQAFPVWLYKIKFACLWHVATTLTCEIWIL